MLTAILALSLSALGVVEAVHVVTLRRYGYQTPTCRVNTGQAVVALSFDDGPDPAYTSSVLALLRRYGDRATFFLTGVRAHAFPELMHEETDAGMEIGNHTWAHPRLSELSAREVATEVGRTQSEVTRALAAPALFRAPFGLITPDQLRAVEATGLTPIQWLIPLDHYVGGFGLAPREAAAELLTDIRPGDIILAHDARAGGLGRETAMATLRILLPALQREGFEVVTVSDLLARGVAVRAEPRIWFWQSGFICPRP